MLLASTYTCGVVMSREYIVLMIIKILCELMCFTRCVCIVERARLLHQLIDKPVFIFQALYIISREEKS